MVHILNFVWLIVAAAACAAVLPRRRDGKAIVVVLAVCALLFPIISASDDLAADQNLIDAFAAVLVAIACIVALTEIFRVAIDPRQRLLLAVPVHSDPRSPPRG
jgi:UDP-N-acetylmuramyl pentapeptide phosphotransferase/UDP-N-acetylglucosamine-1-phosphate transferase